MGELRRLWWLMMVTAAWSAAGAGWWNDAWSHRKRVRVRLAAETPLGFDYRPPDRRGDEVVAAEAIIQTEIPLKAGPANEVRVVDPAGNLLPCVVNGPDSAGRLRVVFPARRVIVGQLLEPIGEKTTEVPLSPGRDKAARPGMVFNIFAAWERVATLRVEKVGEKTSRARIVEKTVPTISKGTTVRSEVITDAEYAIYYGNPNSKQAAPSWTPPSAPVTQYGWRITSGSVPRSVEQLRQVMRASPAYVGAHSDDQVNSRTNPLDYDSEAYYVSAYEGMIKCGFSGLYRFSIDSGGPAYLFVDGKLAAQRPGFFLQTGQFEHRGKLELAEGVHHLVLLATENAKRRVTRLAWQPVTATVFSLMPESAFTARVPAEAVGLDTRDGGPQVFFTTKLCPLRVKGPDGTLYQFVQFQNRSPAEAAGAEVKCGWEFGDGEQSREGQPGHLYTLGPEANAFKATLRVYAGGREAGAYQRTVSCTARPAEKLNLALEVMSFANIAYDDEKTTIAARIRSANHSPLVVRAVGRLVTSKGKHVLLNALLPIAGQDENFCILPLDLKTLEDRRAFVDLDIMVGSHTVASTGARVLPTDSLLVRGSVRPGRAGISIAADGPLAGIARRGDFPTDNYELALKAWATAPDSFPSLVLPSGRSHRVVPASEWASGLRPGQAHELLLRVQGGKLQALADGKKVAEKNLRECPPLADALAELKPFGIYVPHGQHLVVLSARVRPVASANARQGGKQKPPGEAPWTELVKPSSLEGWRAVTPDQLALLHGGLGALYDHEGRRVMLCAQVEDPDRHLRWVFARYIHERVIARRWSVLLFGDRMSNLVAPDESFTDYVAILQRRFEKASRPFQFAPRSTGLAPTLSDIVLFGRTLAKLDPLPDIIILSPGLGDVAQAVGHRDFVRSFDVMIDLVRGTGKSIQLILVAPPPSPWNTRLSADYARALRRLARDHHVAFVDLQHPMAGEAPEKNTQWVERWYGIPETDGLYYENPNEAAHKLIAEAIEKALE